MMAFFFTMPISRMMPISAMMLKSVSADQQRQQRADARRGQRGKDRDRVDVALVEHSQHDVDRDQRGQDQQRLVGQREPGTPAAVPWNAAWMLAGIPSSFLRVLMAFTASPSEAPGARLKDMVTTGNWPWWLIAMGPVVVSQCVKALSGTWFPFAKTWAD